MKHASKIAGVVFATLILSTALVQAGALIDVTPEDHTPVSVDTYDPPVDVDTYDAPVDVDTYDAPIDVSAKDNTPVDIANPQINMPGVTFPKTKTYAPTLTFGKPGGTRTIEVAVACQVAGTPVEFPDDLLLINRGTTLGAGTTIKWKVKAAGQGFVQLNADLPPGGSVKATGILGGGVEAGLPCTAKVI